MYNNKIKIIQIFILCFLLYGNIIFGYEYLGCRYSNNSFPTFRVNQDGTPDCTGEFTAIQNAIQTWNNVNTTYINFQYGATTTSTALAYDGTNLIRWVESDWATYFPEYPTALAVNSTWTSGSTALESDIFFNGQAYTWSSTGDLNRYDVQGVCTHEIGHSVGLSDLDGAGDEEKTMYYASATGETKKSSLYSDDEDGARYVNFYPQTSGSLTENQVWAPNLNNNTISLTSSLNTSSYSLSIKSGITLSLNSYSITSTGGTITLESGATINGLKATLTRNSALRGLCSTVQAAVNAITDNEIGNTYDLGLASGSISENISLSNKYGVHFYGSGSTVLNGSLSLTNCESCYFNSFTAQAISLNGCTVPQLTGININISSTNPCLYSYNTYNLYFSGGNISDRYAYTYGTGFNLYSSSTTTINTNLGSTVFYNNVRGIAASGSTVYINNAVFCNNTYDLLSSSGSYISATNCYFPNGVASTQGSGIDLFGNQVSDCSGLPKSSAKSFVSSSVNSDSLSDEFMQINKKNFDLSDRVRTDISTTKSFDKEKFSNDYRSIAGSYNDFINKYPGSDYSKTALTSIVQNYKMLGDYEGMNNYLHATAADSKLKNVSGLAKRFIMDYFSHQKDFTSALKTGDEILAALQSNASQAKDENLTCDVLYAKGLIYSHDLNNSKEAVACFSDIIANHSDNTLADFAKNELQILGIDAEKIAVKNTEVNNSSTISTSNYPNPFNPSTIISYQLPKDGYITLKVYDVLGREVKTLVNEYKIQGKYEITFNGAGLASGVYYYQLRVADPSGKVNNSVVTKKILLMK
jgi:hypothetical protein